MTMAPPPSGTIDLGELPPHDEVRLEPDPWWPVVRRRWRDRRTWRLAAVAAVTTLTAVTVAAAATPARPALTQQFTIAGTSVAYDAQTLYVVDAPDGVAAAGPATITAYRLADGAVRWERSPPGLDGDGAWLTVQAGTLLASSRTGAGNDPQTTRLDPGTGEPLWTQTGLSGQAAGGWLVLERQLATPLPEEPVDDVVPAVELTVVDLATGAPAWRIEILGWAYGMDADGTNLVTMDEHGELHSYDLATGELVATRSLPTPDGPGGVHYYGTLQVIGSVVVLLAPSGATPVITAFDVATLAPRWRSAVAYDESASVSRPTRCGGLVCLIGGESPRALDPATGEQLWSADWLPPDDGDSHWYDATGIGEVHPELLTDHLVVTRIRESSSDQGSWLVEAGTGAPVLDLTRWRFLGAYSQQPATTPAPLLAQQDGRTTWIGRLRPDLSGVVVLGSIDTGSRDDPVAVPPACDARGDRLVCVRYPATGEDRGRTEVWRLPS